MRRLSRQQIHGMRQQRKHRLKRAFGSGRTARQIHNQRTSGNSTHSPAKGRKRSMFQTLSPHSFRQAIYQPLAYQPCSIRGHVPGSKPCSSRGHNQPRIARIMPQSRNNRVHLVRHNPHQDIIDARSFQQPGNGRSGDIDLLSPGTTITDRQYNCASIGGKSLIHPNSLRRE